MKKTQEKILAIFLIAIMLTSLVACGGGTDSIVGKWIPVGDSADSFGLSDLEELGVDEDGMVMEFTKDGKVNILINNKPFEDFIAEMLLEFGMSESEAEEAAKEMAFNMTYKVTGDKISMTSDMDGETETVEGTYKISGNNLTMNMDGEAITFKKK
ncbi:MAG: hypothetical protein GX763_08070 [Clostridiaceae bacterium]|nr:hypothetical protein [Clostridiaceae bacterium]